MQIPVQGAVLYVEVLGDHGPNVALLHGLGGSSETWRGIGERLADRCRVIVPDQRGSGRSEIGDRRYTIGLWADDLVEVLDRLGVDRCCVVGHSLGGVVAQDFLVRYNARASAAVLVSTSSRLSAEATQGWRSLADRVTRKGIPDSPATRENGFSPSFVRAHPEVVRKHAEIALATDPGAYAAQAVAASAYDYTDALAGVTQPVLVLQGLADSLTPPGGSVILSRTLAHATLEMVEAAGHNLPIELGARFADRVLAFLATAGILA